LPILLSFSDPASHFGEFYPYIRKRGVTDPTTVPLTLFFVTRLDIASPL
jgi:hypothetical protein